MTAHLPPAAGTADLAGPLDAPPAPAATGPTRGQLSGPLSFLLLAPLAAILLFAFFVPIARLLVTSVTVPSLNADQYVRLVSQPLYVETLLRTLWIATGCTALALVLGYPVAIFMARQTGFRAKVVVACVMIPLWTSTLVRSYAWIVLLDRNGVINNVLTATHVVSRPLDMMYRDGAVLMAMAHMLMPFMILPIYSALRSIPPELPRAATNLGASRLRAFLAVTVPLSLPGVSAGCLLVFVMALGFYVTPALLGGPKTLMIATLISQQAIDLLNWPFAGAISCVLLVVSLGITIAFKRVLNLGKMMSHD